MRSNPCARLSRHGCGGPNQASEASVVRASTASLPSLFAIGAAFFLPFVKGCDSMVSPIGMVAEGHGGSLLIAWIVPRFAVAALLAVLTLVALWRGREPGRGAAILAGVGVLSLVPASILDGYDLVRKASRLDLFGVGFAAIVFGLGALGLWWAVGACRRDGWARWERFIAAYAALAAPFVWFVVEAFAKSWREVGLGGYAYATSITILLTLRMLSIRSSRPADSR